MKVDNIDRARADLKSAAASVRQGSSFDELYADIAAYHLQQCVEKCIKAILEARHVEYPKTHNIMILQSLATDTMIDSILGPYASVFTTWEATTRYAGEVLPKTLDLSMFVEIAESLYKYAYEVCRGKALETNEF